MKCLVTGATGFIGRPLAATLLETGWQVNALSHRGGKICAGLSAEALDLAIVPVPQALLSGVDVVIHLAGLAHTSGADEDYEALNHRAVISLAHHAQSSGVRHFIFVSSVKAMGPAPADGRKRTERDVVAPKDPYGLSKFRAEQALLEAFEQQEMAVTVVRPALVCGRAVRGNLQLLWQLSRFGVLRPPDAGGRSLIALDDLVSLLRQLAANPSRGYRCFIACDDAIYSTRHLYDLMRCARDRHPGVSLLPLWAWRGICLLRDALPGSGGNSYQKIFGTELYSSQALTRELGWHARTPLAQVITELAGETN